MEADLLLYAGYAVSGVLGLYVAARVVTAAYFKSKQDHESQPPAKGQ